MIADEPRVVNLHGEPGAANPTHGRVAVGLWIGLTIHGAAVALFAVLSAVRLEGCDSGDSLAVALFITGVVDVIVGAITSWRMLRSNDRGRRTAAGLALSFIPALIAAGITLAYINSLPSGCS